MALIALWATCPDVNESYGVISTYNITSKNSSRFTSRIQNNFLFSGEISSQSGRSDWPTTNHSSLTFSKTSGENLMELWKKLSLPPGKHVLYNSVILSRTFLVTRFHMKQLNFESIIRFLSYNTRKNKSGTCQNSGNL